MNRDEKFTTKGWAYRQKFTQTLVVDQNKVQIWRVPPKMSNSMIMCVRNSFMHLCIKACYFHFFCFWILNFRFSLHLNNVCINEYCFNPSPITHHHCCNCSLHRRKSNILKWFDHRMANDKVYRFRRCKTMVYGRVWMCNKFYCFVKCAVLCVSITICYIWIASFIKRINFWAIKFSKLMNSYPILKVQKQFPAILYGVPSHFFLSMFARFDFGTTKYSLWNMNYDKLYITV